MSIQKSIDLWDTVDDIHYYFVSEADCKRFTGLSNSSIRISLNDENYLIKKRYKVKEIEYNDEIIYTTNNINIHNNRLLKNIHPEYYKYLVNKDHDVYPCGQYEEEWICEKCGKVFKDTPLHIRNLKRVFCKDCSIDKWSYPEKIMYHLLKSSNIDFVCHKKFKWSHGKIYDFYLEKEQCIIEVHGIQHYENSSDWTYTTLEEQQRIDAFKRKNAFSQKETPIKHYIVIDARYSNISWITNSIKNSYLANIIDLENVNWEKISELVCEDIYKSVIDLFNSGIYSKTELSKLTHFSKDAIKDALYRNIYLLNYIKTEEDLKYFMSLSKPVEVFYNGELIRRYKSVRECENKSMEDFGVQFYKNIIADICRNKIDSYKGYVFKYCEKADLFKSVGDQKQ